MVGGRAQCEWIDALALIGHELDAGAEVRVLNGGVVVPSMPTVSSSFLGMEMHDVNGKATRRSETRPRSRAPRWEGTAGRPWTTSTAAPVVGKPLKKLYETELSGLAVSYPETQLWHQTDGVWLRYKSKLLDGLSRNALFLV